MSDQHLGDQFEDDPIQRQAKRIREFQAKERREREESGDTIIGNWKERQDQREERRAQYRPLNLRDNVKGSIEETPRIATVIVVFMALLFIVGLTAPVLLILMFLAIPFLPHVLK